MSPAQVLRRVPALALCLLALAGAGLGVERALARPRTVAGSLSSKPPFAVGLRVLKLIDISRTIRMRDGRIEPRTLVTYVRYPASRPSGIDLARAPAARSQGPFPLIVFGHGYALTPLTYTALLRSWAGAGYVVAAPASPFENANAPGGPNEADLVNQPADMRFVISRLLATSRSKTGPLSRLIDTRHIAVAGHSDGGETALAVAYDRPFRDPRVGAAIILSGAELTAGGRFSFPRRSPPLLAAQGSADAINQPSNTTAFFHAAPRPKFLLVLSGAVHLPPYTSEEPQLGIVERVTTAFLDHYFKRRSLQPLIAAGTVPGIAKLTANP